MYPDTDDDESEEEGNEEEDNKDNKDEDGNNEDNNNIEGNTPCTNGNNEPDLGLPSNLSFSSAGGYILGGWWVSITVPLFKPSFQAQS